LQAESEFYEDAEFASQNQERIKWRRNDLRRKGIAFYLEHLSLLLCALQYSGYYSHTPWMGHKHNWTAFFFHDNIFLVCHVLSVPFAARSEEISSASGTLYPVCSNV
jgi:hypothetical protein